jgi:hypothetical protein
MTLPEHPRRNPGVWGWIERWWPTVAIFIGLCAWVLGVWVVTK